MLGLGQQVDCDHERVRVLVRDHQDLGGPGEQVDADLTEQLTLGLGHVRVAGPRQHRHTSDRLGAHCHRRDGLDAAQQVDLVGARQVHGRDRRGRDLAADGRGAGDDPGHARDLGGHDRHVGRRGQRVAAAGHVRAGGGDGHVPVAEADAGQCLDVDVEHRVTLGLGERTHLLLHEADVVEDLLRDISDDALDLLGRQAERLRAPVVELLGVLAHRLVAAFADVVEDGAHSLGDVRAGGGHLGGGDGGLEVSGHDGSLQLVSFGQGMGVRRR